MTTPLDSFSAGINIGVLTAPPALVFVFTLKWLVLSCASLAEEDRYDSYSRMILKYFLAEGVVCRHELFVATAQDDPDEILQVWMHLISSSEANLSPRMTSVHFSTQTTRTGANLATHCPPITIRRLLFDRRDKTTPCWTASVHYLPSALG